MHTTARVAFGGCLAAVAAVAFLPMRLSALHHIPWREAEHSAAFFVLTCGAALSFPRVRLTYIVLIGMALGAAMELAQATPWIGRHGALTDWIADVLGVVAVPAVSGMTALRRRQARPKRSAVPPRPIPDRRVRLARSDRAHGR